MPPRLDKNTDLNPIIYFLQISKLRNSVILEMTGLNEPTFMIESTPVVVSNPNGNNNKTGLKNKKLSRLAMDNNFSPIVFHVPR